MYEGPIYVKSTGRIYSFNGEQFVARFPTGRDAFFWSPPWGKMSEEERLSGAYEYAYRERDVLAYPNVRNFGS